VERRRVTYAMHNDLGTRKGAPQHNKSDPETECFTTTYYCGEY